MADFDFLKGDKRGEGDAGPGDFEADIEKAAARLPPDGILEPSPADIIPFRLVAILKCTLSTSHRSYWMLTMATNNGCFDNVECAF